MEGYMYSKGDYVVYGHNGICRIEDISNPGFAGTDSRKKYYVLEPVNQKGSKIYSPVDSNRVPMRAVMTKKEAEKLIDQIPDVKELWINNEKTREEGYKEAMFSNDPVKWVMIIKTLYFRQIARSHEGKKITATDERYLKLAEDSLYGELAFALKKQQGEMEEYISHAIEGRQTVS